MVLNAAAPTGAKKKQQLVNLVVGFSFFLAVVLLHEAFWSVLQESYKSSKSNNMSFVYYLVLFLPIRIIVLYHHALTDKNGMMILD